MRGGGGGRRLSAKPTRPAMASDSGDRNPTLKKCLAVLREARNDSEQFAALLLVRNGCGMEPPAPSPQERAGEGEGETRFWKGESPSGVCSWAGWRWELRGKVLRCLGVPVSKWREPGLGSGVLRVSRRCRTLEALW